MKAEHKRCLQDHEEARVRSFELANLISFAQHDPKKMPKYKPTSEPEKKKTGGTELDQVKARGAMIAWALSNGAKR